jgi:hypothetical protein
MGEIVAYVRASRGVAYLPVPATAAIALHGVTFVRVDDIPPGRVVLAWDAERPPRHISELRGFPCTVHGKPRIAVRDNFGSGL